MSFTYGVSSGIVFLSDPSLLSGVALDIRKVPVSVLHSMATYQSDRWFDLAPVQVDSVNGANEEALMNTVLAHV